MPVLCRGPSSLAGPENGALIAEDDPVSVTPANARRFFASPGAERPMAAGFSASAGGFLLRAPPERPAAGRSGDRRQPMMTSGIGEPRRGGRAATSES